MIKQILFTLLITASAILIAEPRSDTNFGFGGAATNSQNATALFAPQLEQAVNAAGLELFGLTQQMEFAEATLTKIKPSRDVFVLWAGTNNILAGAVTGQLDPTQAPADIKAAMERMYKDLNARIFVVPNLMLLGNIPQFNSDPATQASINELTAAQNALLAQAIAEFKAKYKRATVISLDVQSLFLTLTNNGDFTNVNESCFATGLPYGLACSSYLYADDIHFSSAAAMKIAELASEQLKTMNIRRFITFGDSFVDTGSFYNTTQRSIGFGIPAARSYQGRFSDGPNFMDHLESIVQPEIPSSAFSQPSRLTIEKGSNDLETEVSFIIPSKLTLTNESRFGFVFLDFEQEGFCWSYPDRKVDRKRKINACSGGLKIGQTVTVDKVLLTAPFTRGEVKTDLFFYQVP